MHQIFFYIGDFPVRAYGLMIDLGIVGGVALAWYLARKRGKYADDVLNASVYAVLGGLLGARLWEVIFDWGYYSGHLAQIPAIWEGGLSVQGGAAGGLLAVILYTRVRRIPFWEFGDIMAPGLLLGQAVGRVGCYLNGCCYGVPTDSAWGVVFPHGTDAYTAYGAQSLLPVMLFEAAWDVAIMALLLYLFSRKPFHGFLVTLYFALYAVGRIAFEFYRTDSLIVWGLKAAQATSLATLLAALAFMFILWRKSQSRPVSGLPEKKKKGKKA